MTPESTLVESPSLRDRVQSLRLPSRADTGGSTRDGWLPWALCLLLALSTASLAARVYTAASPLPSGGEGLGMRGTPPPSPTAQPPHSQPLSPGGERGAAPAPGAVVLESKGYIIPAH